MDSDNALNPVRQMPTIKTQTLPQEKMARIILCFAGRSRPELTRIYFSHHLLAREILSVRGKTGGALAGEATFQWTNAVKAAAALLLDTGARLAAGCANTCQESSAVLEGGAGSAAASLDYALGKETDWLRDVFGADKQGRPLSRKLFLRSNPERKRPGPAAVALNVAAWAPLEVVVLLEEQPVRDASQLLALAEAVCPEPHPAAAPAEFVLPQTAPRRTGADRAITLDSFMRPLLLAELRCGFAGTNIFNRRELSEASRRIESGASFRRISGGKQPILNSIDLELAHSERLGLVDDERFLRKQLCARKPLRIALAVPCVGAEALFYYLLHVKKYNIELCIQHLHAVEIARRLIRGEYADPPDVCCLGVAPAASIIAHSRSVQFYPLMLMPRTSQAVVSHAASKDVSLQSLSFGEFAFINEDPSVPSFVFEEICAGGHLRRRNVSVSHSEPDEVFVRLRERSPDLHSILFFPHYEVNRTFSGCRIYPVPNTNIIVDQMVLFVHSSLLADKERVRALDIALRDAWLELKSSRAMLEHVVDAMLGDPVYRKVFIRSAGLHNIPDFEGC